MFLRLQVVIKFKNILRKPYKNQRLDFFFAEFYRILENILF